MPRAPTEPGSGHVFVLHGDSDALTSEHRLGLRDLLGNESWELAGGPHPLPTRHGRARPLVAVPLPAADPPDVGEVLEAAAGLVERPGSPDLVLVTPDRACYHRAQRGRPAPDLGELAPVVQRLARLARSGRLVAFLGAGVSRAAGIPTWEELIEEMARRAGMGGADLERLMRMRPLDAAEVIASRLERPPGAVVTELMAGEGRTHSLTHGLVASLRLPGAVTTNYDDLFELACRVPHGRAMAVLPRELPRLTSPEQPGHDPARTWLLKLHGDVAEPQGIVLTRGDYLDLDATRVPLASVLQSHMITHHLLLVGYSLSDDSFVRLARQVRALHPEGGRGNSPAVGTVLSLQDDPLLAELWAGTLQFVAPASPGSAAEAARALEVLLDGLAQACSVLEADGRGGADHQWACRP